MKKLNIFIYTVVLMIIFAFSAGAVTQQNRNFVYIAEGMQDFCEAVSSLVEENDDGMHFSTLEIKVDDEKNLSNNKSDISESLVNGSVDELKTGNAGIALFSAIDSKSFLQGTGIDNISEKEFLTVDEIEEYGFDVDFDEEKVYITKPFHTKRLIVKQKNIDNYYGADAVISDGNELYVLQYETINEAKKAYEKFVEVYGSENVGIDKFIELYDIASAVEQQGGNNTAQERIESKRYINFLKENNYEQEISVAVLDSGVDSSHPNLIGRLSEKTASVISDSNDKEDVDGHGTHVAGIIANNTPDNVMIMPVRCFYEDGMSTELLAKLAIDYAIENGAEVINMSFGGPCDDDYCILDTAIAKATKAGVVCVAAAGNESANVETVCPARFEECITVSSVNSKDQFSHFSNMGTYVDIAAPGENVWSTVPVKMGSFDCYSGTSMAAPFVSAAAAMIKLTFDSETVQQVETELKKATVDLGLPGEDDYYGAGVLDFGVLLGDSVQAEKITVTNNNFNYYWRAKYYGRQPQIPDIVVEPFNATDKSVSAVSSDPYKVKFDGYKISVADLFEPNLDATIDFQIANGERATCSVKSIGDVFWDSPDGKFFRGAGTQDNPYLIETPEQLAKMSNIATYINKDLYFKLTADIDLKGKSWYPVVALSDEGEWLSFNLDGDGHTIYNLTIKDYNIDDLTRYAGLFGISCGEIKNLNLVNVNIDCPSAEYVGAICAYSSGYIKNCYVSGTVNGKTVGGVVGMMGWTTDSAYGVGISDCRSDAFVTGEVAGGIVGAMDNGIVNNCVSVSSVTGNISGGIAGSMKSLNGAYSSVLFVDHSKIINCVSTTNIAGQKKYGYNSKNKFTPVIENCYCVSENPVTNDYTQEKTKCGQISLENIKTKSFYSDSEKWTSDYVWDTETLWTVEKDYPELTNQHDNRKTAFFDYIDLGNAVKITKYTGPFKSVTIPDYIDSKPVKYIGKNILGESGVILKVSVPDTVEYISAMAFAGSEYLAAVELGKGVRLIDSFAFAACANLCDVIIPESVEGIGNFAFYYSALSKIAFEGDKPENTGTQAFDCTLQDSKVKLYHIEGAEGWSDSEHSNTTKVVCKESEAVVMLGETFLRLSKGDNYTVAMRTFPKEVPVRLAAKYNSSLSVSGKNISVKSSPDYVEIIAITEDNKLRKYIDVFLYGSADYVINYDGNGADSGYMFPTMVEGGNSVYLRKNQFVKEGYVFVGWSKTPDGEVAYSDGVMCNKVFDYGTTGTLYAVWVPVPGTPEKLSFTSTESTVTLKWNTVKDATGYRVYQKVDGKWKKLYDITENTYKLSALKSGTVYSFAVKAYSKSNGKTYWASNYTSIKTATAPATVKSITATQKNTSVILSWSKAYGATGYRVYQSVSGKWKALKTTTATSYTVTGLTVGKKYIFAVKPYTKFNSSNIWASTYARLTVSVRPETPVVRVASTAKGRATLAWYDIEGEKGYQVWYSTSKDGKYIKITNCKADTKKFYKTGLKSGTTYYFKVRAYTKTDGKYVYSSYSAVKSLKIK